SEFAAHSDMRYASHSVGGRSSTRSRCGLARCHRWTPSGFTFCPILSGARKRRPKPDITSASVVPKHTVEINARFFPIALHRTLGNARHRCDFHEGKPTEELEIDDAGEACVRGFELIERVTAPPHLLPTAGH